MEIAGQSAFGTADGFWYEGGGWLNLDRPTASSNFDLRKSAALDPEELVFFRRNFSSDADRPGRSGASYALVGACTYMRDTRGRDGFIGGALWFVGEDNDAAALAECAGAVGKWLDHISQLSTKNLQYVPQFQNSIRAELHRSFPDQRKANGFPGSRSEPLRVSVRSDLKPIELGTLLWLLGKSKQLENKLIILGPDKQINRTGRAAAPSWLSFICNLVQEKDESLTQSDFEKRHLESSINHQSAQINDLNLRNSEMQQQITDLQQQCDYLEQRTAAIIRERDSLKQQLEFVRDEYGMTRGPRAPAVPGPIRFAPKSAARRSNPDREMPSRPRADDQRRYPPTLRNQPSESNQPHPQYLHIPPTRPQPVAYRRQPSWRQRFGYFLADAWQAIVAAIIGVGIAAIIIYTILAGVSA